MAWPVYKRLLSDVLENINSAAIKARDHVKTVSDASSSGNIARQRLVNLLVTLTSFIDTLDAASGTSGIVAYTRDQYRETGLDVSAEFAAMRQAAVGLRAWINTNFPREGTAILLTSMAITGVVTPRTFTSAALSGFRTEAQTFIDTIAIVAP